MDTPGRLWPRADLRVSDADRRTVVAELQRHFIDGRLTSDELAERVAQTYSARTFADLAVLLTDLPELPSTALQTIAAPADPADEDESQRFILAPVLGMVLVIMGVMAVLWTLAFPMVRLGLQLHFLPIFVVGFFFFSLARRPARGDRWHRGGPPRR